MTWKNYIALVPIAPRRRVVATALIYGLSLAVRFTSAAGEEAEIPAQVIVNDGAEIISMASRSRSGPAYLGWPAGSECRAACESPIPMSPMPGCAVHP
jgi:hypothetical protein